MKIEMGVNRIASDSTMLLVSIVAIILPLSLSFWIVCFLSSWYSSDTLNPPSPLRWLLSFLIPIIMAGWGLQKRSITISGAFTGVIVGFVLTLSNYCFMASLLAFFVLSSKATKYKAAKKKKFDSEYKEGGQRNWIQVISNGGVATEFAVLYLIEHGIGEIPIDFHNNYGVSCFAIAVLAAIAGASGDTWASEIGSVLSQKDPVLITTLRRVPRGTNGGVSIIGFLASILGGTIVGLAYYISLLLCLSNEVLAESTPQWPLILTATFSGFFSSLIDSILGATLQYSGINVRTGKIVEKAGPGVKHISGISLLDNHSVNLVSSILTALLIPRLTMPLWTYF